MSQDDTSSSTTETVKEPELVKTDNSTTNLENGVNEEEKISYNGAKVLRVLVPNKEVKKLIKQMENNGEINTWMGNGTAIDILVRQNNVYDVLKTKKLSYDVVIDDLQKAIEEENPSISQDEWSELEGRKGHRMTWHMYHRMSDIHGYLDYLTATYPDVCSLITIGHSVERRPLKVLKISSGNPNSKAIWMDSGIHAREWISPATSTYAISQMVENGDGTHGVDWYILPLVNPDGYEHSHIFDRLWRKNRANAYRGPCAGTDLNRNFGYKWGGQGASQLACRETYAGPSPFSEPETKAIQKFVGNSSNNFGAYVSLHSYGQYILYPWGYDRKVPPDYSDLHRVGRAMAQAIKGQSGQSYTVGSAAATLYPAAGGSDDWAKGTAKIKYAYTIELRDTGRHGFVLPAQYIVPTAQEAYAALKVLAQEVSSS
ncbi:carboxypeptidase A, putative [Pediculus humanus corporis]|uniref:Carboxypeptidase A, putative n=1 Tax=Pediculus humanus subsp. corporis TaxID=121224 RepID=E0VDV1_PEDHC|nr:carboxypeptidase A, putative [Pediculus humanus corporis]EEB11557.1 carboxypeptidase A, putative [Pediculus humanus corporis]